MMLRHFGRPALDGDRLDRRDPSFVARLLAIFRRLNTHYFRLRAEGFDKLPTGPVLYVGNHSGGMAGPDLVGTLGSLWEARGVEAPLYALAHDFAMRQVTSLGAIAQRAGALRAKPENALRALGAGAQVLVYPGGELDAYRHARRRDEIVFGARTGFVRVAQAGRVPIVPIVAYGAHRSAYVFSEGERLARRLALKRWARVERLPVALAFPWGIAVGPWLPYFPLPFRVDLKVLPPIEAPQAKSPEAIRDQVQLAMQVALDAMAREARRPTADA